ncbi:putative ABC transporter permease protein [[Clostridium] ultunense Esp]|uniref:Transport permease protein n=1 Tax=[Clostridium] ultunense Esp TaxID=1288971 RepID=M1ZGA3_9FIRM|nr:ABC transporter permease [Schnuerera ultunensis]CCQ92782.1 putative ABC transporter permease protein [[Clostridium] ultunense Esp]SHD75794.1 putative ABC transporter permease protein [[Clostridium] ultunense Esp]
MKFKNYLSAIKAIIKKDAKIFFRYPANAVFRIVEPIIWITPVYFLSKAFQINGENIGFSQYSGTTDYMAFLVIGSIVSSFISSVLWGMGFSLKNEMDVGVIESNWLTPIPLWVQLIGRSIFSLIMTTINALTVAILIWIMFGFNITGGILPAIITLLPMLIALYGLGFGIASLVLMTNNANNIIDITNFSLNMLSGESFPITVLPKVIIPISLSLPITYGYDSLRGVLLGTNTLLPIHLEQLILVGFMIIGIFLGYKILIKVEKHCRTVGNIGFH